MITHKSIKVLAACVIAMCAASANAQPLIDASLKLWLDADDPAAFILNGSAVETWLDKSGNNNHATAPSVPGQPILTAGAVNGLPGVRFDNIDDGLAVADTLVVNRPYSIFIVDQYSGPAHGRTLQSRDPGVNWLIGKWGNGNAHFANGWVTVGGGVPATDFVPVIGEGLGGNPANSRYYINGANRANTGTPNGSPGRLGFGASGAFAELSNADIGEVIVYDRVLTKSERHDVGRYLQNKWGIPGNYLDSSTFANHGTMSAFSGADAGEGLDLDGNFVYAVNAGGPSIAVGSQFFTNENVTAGFSLSSNNILPAWATIPEYGASPADDALESVMHAIRWSGGANPINNISIDMDVTPGDTYKLQLLFSENINSLGPGSRIMDISVNGRQQVDQFLDANAITGHNANDPLVQGAVFTYEFTANASLATVVIEAAHFGNDSNPALNALTLENLSQPGGSSIATGTATIGNFSGGDVGEGLDLDGNFLYAVNVGGEETTVRDVTFADNVGPPPAGVVITAQNHANNWYAPVNYGDSADDNALEVAMADIRWSGRPNNIEVFLQDLTPGQDYKLQLLFDEACCDRGVDIFIDGQLVGDNIPTGPGGDALGWVFTFEFNAPDSGLNIAIDARDTPFADHNPILNAFTLEIVPNVIPEPTSAALLLLTLAPAALRRRLH